MFVLWTKIVLIWMGCVLSCRPVGVIEGEQFISLPQCAFSEWLICGVQSMTALDFSHLMNKIIETIPMLRGRW